MGETSGTDSYVYSYDAGGNLVSVQKNGEVIKSYTYGDASWKDLLTAFNGQSITYDAIGNPLSYRGMTLSWEGGRRLASVSKEGLSASYVYNTDGIRTQKTVNGVTTNYYLDGNSILRQVTGNDVLEFFYDTNGVLGFYYNNTPYYYLKNLQGDIVGILDANGTQVVSYTYDAWGAPLSVTGTAADTIGQINPFRYRSYYYDNETGLYYLNSRYYDPETCRFISVDGIYDTNTGLLSHNMFAYCNNNPVNMIDSTGTGPWWNDLWNDVKEAVQTIIDWFRKDEVETVIDSVVAFEDTCDQARQDYHTHIANVINANSTSSKPKKQQPYLNSDLNKALDAESDASKKAYVNLDYEFKMLYNVYLHEMTWEDIEKNEEYKNTVMAEYGKWDQQTQLIIATHYGISYSTKTLKDIFV